MASTRPFSGNAKHHCFGAGPILLSLRDPNETSVRKSGKEAAMGLRAYFRFYNEQRPHQAPGYVTSAIVYAGADR
ncbi:MAG: transposase [Deltaproteobacteria bacterium]|nr:transposase [Deltaproteobacteria bacterium]